MTSIRTNFVLFFISVLFLRLLIGFHFYQEGINKVKSGSFTSAPFLSSAKGPLAGFYHGMVDDYDGRIRLCLSTKPGSRQSTIDTTLTFAIWEDFVGRAKVELKFNDQQVIQAERMLAESKKYLTTLLDENRDEILAWASGQNRLQGFDRDGAKRKMTVQQVASLNDQVQQIAAERQRKAAGWLVQVENTWDQLEASINSISNDAASNDSASQLDRPYREPNSAQSLIDRFLPWFDCIVGGLLIVGLFTRLAALAGSALLLGVVCSQPPWLMGSENTFYQWIEIAGLFVLFAVAAGRFGGLDYFLMRKSETSEVEEFEL